MTFLYLTGGNLNILTMMGLMLGIGMLVDNAVVVLESINRRRNLGASRVAAALRGTRDVARAIVASTLTTVIVFAPIIVGRSGRDDDLARPDRDQTIGVTIVCSLLVSLTVIPTLSIFLSRSGSEPGAAWIDGLRRRYLRLVRWTTSDIRNWTGLAIRPVWS